MTDANPAAPARPIVVWLVSVGYGLLALGSIANTILLATGALPVPEPYRSQLSELGALQWATSLVGGILMLGFSVELFRLRSSAVRWCEGLILLSLATTFYQIGRFGLPAGPFGSIALVTTTFSLALLAAIYLYARALRSRGALR